MIAPVSLAAFTAVPGLGPVTPPTPAMRGPAAAPLAPFKPAAPAVSTQGQTLPRGSLLDLTA